MFVGSWEEFAEHWLVSLPHDFDPVQGWEALQALEQWNPEALAQLTTSNARGPVMFASAIAFGTALVKTAPLVGFAGVARRLQTGRPAAQAAARAELMAAAALVDRGWQPQLEPALNGKTLDAVVLVGQTPVYIEVISPETSDPMQAAQEALGGHAIVLAEQTAGRGAMIEILLRSEPQFVSSEELLAALPESLDLLTELPIPGVEGLALLTSIDAVPTSRLPDNSDGPVLIAVNAKGTSGGGWHSHVTMRHPARDERAQRLMQAETHHFSADHSNVLVIDITRVPGGMRWGSLIQRRLQPNQNRRFGAVILVRRWIGESNLVEEEWRVVRNPHAYQPVPEDFLASFETA